MGRRWMREFAMVVVIAATAAVAGCGSTPSGGDAGIPAAPGGGSAAGTPRGGGPMAGQPSGGANLDDMVRGVQADESRRRQEARFYWNQAEKFFADSEYEKAEELYGRALERDPSLDEAKRKRVLCLMFLGRRAGEIKSMMEEFADQIQVIDEQRLAETRQLITQGKRYLEADNVELALRSFTQARENLLWFDYGVDVSELEREATELFESTRDLRLKLEASLRLKQEQGALAEAERQAREAEQRRQGRVDLLTRRAQDAMRREDYANALELCDSILEIDAENREISRLRGDAQELYRAQRIARILETNETESERTWEDLDEVTIPYDIPFRFTEDEKRWRTDVARRAREVQEVRFEEDYEIQEIRRTLNSVSPSFAFENDEPLSEVVAFLRSIADLNITIDPEIDPEEKTVNLKLDGVRLSEALDLILANIGLAYTFRENTLYITTPEKAHGNTIFHIYNVTDLLNRIRDFPGPTIRVRSNDESDDGGGTPFGFGEEEEEDFEPLTGDDLAELIRGSTGGDEAWDESGSEIVSHGGQLLVTATRELHNELQDFLENMRKDSDLFVIVEARFIDLVDDFLEDIGIDSRNLGQPPGTGFGTAYGLLNSSTSGGVDPGFMNLGNPNNPSLIQGLDRLAGRIQHILDGFVGGARGSRLNSALRGLTLQVTWLDPFQINAILRASHESRQARTITAPRVTASNGQRVHVSVITQRSYVQDYELVSGGTGLVVQEVADPVVATFQDGVILDVRPVISADRKYITLDVRPVLASLINGVISTVTVSLGSLLQAATLVDIDLPEISLQQAFTSVTVPDGGTVLLGGFRSMNERKYESFLPIIGELPLLKNAFRRKAYLNERRSLYILLTARVVDLRAEERELYN